MAVGGDLSARDGAFVAVALAFLGAAGYYYMFPHVTRAEQLTELETRVEVLDRINQRAAADLASGNVQQLQVEAEQYATAFAALRQLVPQSNEVPTLLEQVSTAARREGLEVGGIRPEPVIDGPDFDTYRYTISVSGGYHSVARFLTNIGGLSRIVTPVDVTLRERVSTASPGTATGGGAGASLDAEFEIRTYVARDRSAPSATAGGN